MDKEIYPFLLSTYLEMEGLYHMIGVFLTTLETAIF